jgi:hypothetical protein
VEALSSPGSPAFARTLSATSGFVQAGPRDPVTPHFASWRGSADFILYRLCRFFFGAPGFRDRIFYSRGSLARAYPAWAE